MPVVVAGAVRAHRRMPLSLSFDHRCITGGEACRFLGGRHRATWKGRTNAEDQRMYQASSEQHRKIVVRRRARRRRGRPNRCAIVDCAALSAGVLRQRRCGGPRRARSGGARGAALSHFTFARRRRRSRAGAGIQSHPARTRLHLAAHRHRDGERRHAVSRRFDQPRADAARAHPAFSGASRSSRWRATAPAICCARSREASRRRPTAAKNQRLESFQHIEVDRIVDPAALHSLAAEIERSMRDVRVACADWAQDAEPPRGRRRRT